MPSNYARFLYLFTQEKRCHFRYKHQEGLLRCAKKFRVNREFQMLTSDTFGETNVRCETDASTAPEFQNAGQQTLSPKQT